MIMHPIDDPDIAGWNFTTPADEEDMARDMGIAVEEFRAGLDELVDAGFLVRLPWTDEAGAYVNMFVIPRGE